MTLLDLLTAMVFIAPFCGAIVAVKVHHGGFLDYILAFIVGLGLAVCFGWLDYKKNRRSFQVFQRRRIDETLFILPILSVVLFICGDIVGFQVTIKLMALFS